MHLLESYERTVGNIYSLFSISSFHCPNPSDFKIDSKVLEFGDYVVMIKDGSEFLKKN